jgi:GNAT acetyltransferase
MISVDDEVARVRALWRALTSVPEAFATAVTVAASDGSQASPPGWVGIVHVDAAAVVVSPPELLDRVQSAIGDLDADALRDTEVVDRLLRPAETLGPALLFYGGPSAPAASSVIGPLALDDPIVESVLRDSTDAERGESGIPSATSGIYVSLGADAEPEAVCGWSEWPEGIAHVCILTAASRRGRGAATRVAAGTLEAAVAQGLLPQWRAREGNEASVATACGLGLVPLGRQYSLWLG